MSDKLCSISYCALPACRVYGDCEKTERFFLCERHIEVIHNGPNADYIPEGVGY